MIEPEALLQHAEFIRSLACRLVGDDATVDDVLQSTWLAAVTAPPRDASSLRPWLARVAVNFARRIRRDSGTRERHERSAAAARPELRPDIAQSLGHEEAIRGVVDAVFALSEPYRTAIVLHYYEGLRPGQIADRLGVPTETVRTRLKRAIAKMREHLDDRHGGDRRAWSVTLVPLLGIELPPGSAAGATVPAGSGRVPSRVTAPKAIAATALLAGSAFFLYLDPFAGHSSESSLRSSSIGSLPLSARDVASPAAAGADSRTPSERSAGAATTDAPPAASGTGALLVRLRWEEDGLPAAGVRIGVLAKAVADVYADPDGHRLDRASAVDGTVRVEALPAGEYVLRFDRMAPVQDVKIESSRETELSVDVPTGTTIEGIVLDASGAPVGEAEIVMCSPASADLGVVVARTAADGLFRVKSVSVEAFLGARAALRSPSTMVALNGRRGHAETVSVELHLRRTGGDVVGRVEDADGRRIAGADVVLGDRFVDRLDPTTLADVPRLLGRSRRLLTNAEGEFRFPGVAPGKTRILVHSAHHAPFASTLRVEPGTSTTMEVHLVAGPTLEGTIRHADGSPAASVAVGVAAPGFSDLGIDRVGSTGADGSYRLDHVFPGMRVLAQATDLAGNFVVSDSLDTGEEGVIRWDATLRPTPRIVGRLVGENGTPLALWEVMLRAPDPHAFLSDATGTGIWGTRLVTDAEGKFETWCLDRAHRIEVWEPGQWSKNPCFVVSGVSPSPDERVIRVPAAARPSAFVIGTLVSESGGSVGPAAVWANPLDVALSKDRASVEPGGAIRLGPLVPGRYNLTLGIAGYTVSLRESAELVPDQTLDLGEIRVSEPGSLAVRLHRPDGGPIGRPTASVHDSRGEWTAIGGVKQSGDVLGVSTLAPGRYSLLVYSNDVDIASAEYPFEIRSGEETRFDVELRSGVLTTVTFIQPPDEEWSQRLRVRIRDQADATVWRMEYLGPSPDRRFHVHVHLLPGVYTVEANGDTGMTATQSFEISAQGPSKQSVEVALAMPQ